MNAVPAPLHSLRVPSPFNLGDARAFARWAAWKRAWKLTGEADLMVEITDPFALTAEEMQAMGKTCLRYNMALFKTPTPVGKGEIRALARAFGLTRLDGNLCADGDGVTTLKVADGGRGGEYIPYSDKPLRWHTDGYYNDQRRQIGGFILYCVQDAAEGGENALLDPEWVYLLMREEEPAWVRALSAPDAMTIPPNVENGVEIRPARAGPVFTVCQTHGTLHMRYTARKRHIQWKRDPATREALAWLQELMSTGDAPIVRRKLRPGEGIISNNTLHNRAGFTNALGAERLFYRARYHDRIAGTGLVDLPGGVLNF